MFENRFRGRVAVVTGGASGIGAGIAQRIAAEGGQVVLFDVNIDKMRRVVDDLQSQRLLADSLAVDTGDANAVRDAFQTTVERYGHLDIMVNCAGITGPTDTLIAEFDTDAFDRVIRVNLRGAYLTTKYAVQHMLERNYGRILQIASISGKEGNPGMIGYSTSKGGVIALVKAVGKEYAETGITVNGLAPALIHTPLLDGTAPEAVARLSAKIPMNRLGTVDEVAALACWIVSDEATFNTGAIFDLSGGRATY
jgi:3-oxoacyl-[acyl-carrier protein] reductase